MLVRLQKSLSEHVPTHHHSMEQYLCARHELALRPYRDLPHQREPLSLAAPPNMRVYARMLPGRGVYHLRNTRLLQCVFHSRIFAPLLSDAGRGEQRADGLLQPTLSSTPGRSTPSSRGTSSRSAWQNAWPSSSPAASHGDASGSQNAPPTHAPARQTAWTGATQARNGKRSSGQARPSRMPSKHQLAPSRGL